MSFALVFLWFFAFAITFPGPSLVADDCKCSDLSFGQKQVLQLLSDRPAMAGVLDKDGPTYKWVCEQFSHGYDGRRIHWDYALPQSGLDSEYLSWTGGGHPPGFVRISGRPGLSGIDQWMVLLYELENIKNATELARLIASSIENASTREEFIKSSVRMEFDAFHRLKKRLVLWNELGIKSPLSPRESWVVDVEEDFDVFYERTKQMPLHRKAFETMYDTAVAPHIDR
ncbi:hypothetical protein SH528x_003948 [Novipirellula sp. SH528]|uniref:hypothetical protein n=1 Tax=Novipirellula sp. SH528 TaxID=3454466 RepID=UPI003F9FD325